MGYFSNGFEVREVLEPQCEKCKVFNNQVAGDDMCPIAWVNMNPLYDNQHKPGHEELRACLNELIDENGVCQVKAYTEKTL